MSLINLLIVLVILGGIIYVASIIPLPHPWKTIVMVVVALICLVYLLNMLGALGGAGLRLPD